MGSGFLQYPDIFDITTPVITDELIYGNRPGVFLKNLFKTVFSDLYNPDINK